MNVTKTSTTLTSDFIDEICKWIKIGHEVERQIEPAHKEKAIAVAIINGLAIIHGAERRSAEEYMWGNLYPGVDGGVLEWLSNLIDSLPDRNTVDDGIPF